MILPEQIAEMRIAQQKWAARPVRQRLECLQKLRAEIGRNAEKLAASSANARSRPMAESLTAEVLPLAEACRFLERNAARILSPVRFGKRGRPLWLTGVRSEVVRDPLGIVLVIGPGNYPLLLPGVQMIQALIAGNAVLLKPGTGGTECARLLIASIIAAGFDASLIHLFPESVDSVRYAIRLLPDKVIFTGSAEVGKKIAAMLVDPPIPAIMELSGCDGVILRADADIELAVKALKFATALNAGNTCMVPQRLFVHRSILTDMEKLLGESFPPLTPFEDDQEAAALLNDCTFALGASIFSRDESAARILAGKLQTGLVTINDIIVSSADARLPFGGRRGSGYGSTRGSEGLLELTQPKSITVSSGRFRPAYQPLTPIMVRVILGYTRLTHMGFRPYFTSIFKPQKRS
jgi:acyl-CoA reductase-like NAD-dependent aldehyde dehydrogenase